ncbi:MAG: response regulator transcription factor [Bacteroidetes bacterium]|nr:response regulator transcription factor [Bacteroidota bacterium]
MFEIGVCGYILKNTDAKELTRAINLILKGNFYHTPEVMDTWSKFIANKALLEKQNSNKVM